MMKITIITMMLCACQGANILGVFPLPSRSHYILGSCLMRSLANRGHNITVISAFGEQNVPNNGSYRDIVLTGFLEETEERHKKINMFDLDGSNPFVNAAVLALTMSKGHERALKHKNVQELIHSGEIFDVVIVEQFLNDAHKALATHFKAPLILFSTVGTTYWVNSLVGNPGPPAYIPDIMANYGDKMNFYQRLTNSAVFLFNELFYHLYFYPMQDQWAKTHISNDLNLYDSLYNASIVLLNSHPTSNQPVPHVPNMIEIGGFHIQPPKDLPEDLQEFIDNAEEGVIYFSMGSNLKSIDLHANQRLAFRKAFAKLKQKILWKWENDTISDLPDNVKIRKWLPQQDILAHRNVKLFITHGGLLSMTETVHYGIPVLVIPVYGDQKFNAKIAVGNGIGLSLPYHEVDEETLTEKLTELLTNPRYRREAKRRSVLFNDRQIKPLETAMYWIEYVIRHQGAPHLRVSALDLAWYQYYLLDVAIFTILSVLITMFICLILFKKLHSIFIKQKVKMN